MANHELIIPEYDGNFSDRLEWNTQALNRFGRLSDLRTRIHIYGGDANPQNQSEALGDVLAFKRLADVNDLFRISVNRSNFVETGKITPNGTAGIYVNHKLITDYVLTHSDGVFNEQMFSKLFNNSVKDGLVNILAQEKAYMALSSGSHFIRLGFWGALAYLNLNGSFTDFFFPEPDFMGVAERLLGFGNMVQALIIALSERESYLTEKRKNRLYMCSVNDFINPAKPPKDFALGYLWLKQGRNTVVQIPQ